MLFERFRDLAGFDGWTPFQLSQAQVLVPLGGVNWPGREWTRTVALKAESRAESQRSFAQEVALVAPTSGQADR